MISLNSLHSLRHWEACHDFHVPNIKQINSLIQFDSEPNLALKEAKIELYKVISYKKSTLNYAICYI